MSKEPSLQLLLDPASVKANQQGQITDSQRAQHQELGLGCAIPLGLFLVALLGVCIFSFGEFVQLVGDNVPDPLPRYLILLTPLFFFVLFPGGLLFGFLSGRIRDRRITHELDAAEIAQVEGEVVMRDGGYRARVAGRPLSTLPGSKNIQLMPGEYRFYYLPRMRRILSAERLETNEPGERYAGLLQTLAQTNNFTLEDLKLNRQGLLSDRQRAQVKGKKQDREADLRDGRVAMVEGVVARLDWSDTNNDTQAYEIMGANQTKLRFVVGGFAYNALIPEVRYRIYYLPHTQQLASIEPLP